MTRSCEGIVRIWGCPNSRTEGGWGANDNSLALDLLGEVDFVAGRVLDQNVQVRNGVALLDEAARCAVEGGGADAGKVGGNAAGEHNCDSIQDSENEIIEVVIEKMQIWDGRGGGWEVALLMLCEEELHRIDDFVIGR